MPANSWLTDAKLCSDFSSWPSIKDSHAIDLKAQEVSIRLRLPNSCRHLGFKNLLQPVYGLPCDLQHPLHVTVHIAMALRTEPHIDDLQLPLRVPVADSF